MLRRTSSLRDRLWAFATLRPSDAATQAAIHEMLRPREPAGEVKVAARRAAPGQTSSVQPPVADSLMKAGTGTTATDPPPEPPRAPRRRAAARGTTRVTPLPRQPLPAPTTSAPSLGTGGAAHTREPGPLIEAGRTRAVLAALAAAASTGLDIDVAALLARIVRGLPIEHLPLRSSWSLRKGAQLLVDCSPVLMPMSHDVDTIEQRLLDVVGKDRLQRLYFAGCPSRDVGPADRSSWKTWQPPAPGVPVIVLTDLGCAGPMTNPDWAAPEEWARFAARARGAGVALVALVPYPVQRVPAPLPERITVVPWNETLSAARVRRILHDARSRRTG